jgi:hypothetical protein
MRAACGDFSAACRYSFAAAASGVEAASLKGTKNALACGARRAPLHPRDFVAMLATSEVEPARFSTLVAALRPPNGPHTQLRAASPSQRQSGTAVAATPLTRRKSELQLT